MDWHVRTLRTLSLSYDKLEDRLLFVANVGNQDEWACWVTRRLTLLLAAQLDAFFRKSSPAASQAPFEYRSEVVDMERQAAFIATQKAVSRTDQKALKDASVTRELASQISLGVRGTKLVLDIRVFSGEQARGVFSRAELQTVLKLIQLQSARAAWAPPSQPDAAAATAIPARERGLLN